MIRASKKVLLAKIETAYGVDAAPTGAADALLARNFSLTPLEGSTVTRTHIAASMGGYEDLPMAGLNATVTFDIDLTGAGAAGSTPAYHALLRGCGFAATITPGVSVTYNPVSATFESLTLYCYRDGVLHAITGARGEWSLKIGSKGEPLINFKMLGNYHPVSDMPLPAVTLPTYVQPLIVDSVNTPTFSLHGYNAVMQSLDLAGGNDVQYRDRVNEVENVAIMNRNITGTVVVEEPAVASFNYWNASINGGKGAMSLIHGHTAGNIVEISTPNTQIGKIAINENNGVAYLSIPVKALRTGSGNNEISLVVR